ncbi:hypothetical protein QBC34DRAFT_378181 [Podospora aff. communis PSN243]|uniref:HhH-GPD domain-containing protein n=1 Tax=Podospora aff. communis PSN243 TaxID=3040156 RepID=A0AAV9GVU4_9PEZI|nr:hypothetical protein QBC34DRAFT_378181 [Podospora aff. communis PSN243]
MGNSTPSPDTITADEFAEYLSKYPSSIEAISASKGAKPGQKTLSELDEYRYVEAINTFTPTNSSSKAPPMTLDNVKLLVEWKLRHGTFRPTLMSLVSSNPPATVQSTISSAITTYRTNSNISTALTTLTELKGIGPATASLLLAVHDADKVIFFADEAFYWLCLGGVKGGIKYTAKEYAMLSEKAKGVCERLGVRAVDVERVAFVLMREVGESMKEKGRGKEKKDVVKVEEGKKGVSKAPVKAQGKRKAAAADESEDVKADPTRRSKRGKQS